jgi:hypothetical protein
MPFAKGDTVNTVYGYGYVEDVRETDYVVKLKCWALAQGQSPTLYLTEEGLSSIPNIVPGDKVKTFCGPATVTKVRPDSMFVCAPVWKLADYSPDVFLYLNADSVSSQ